jgi:uncharacterized membrane protein YbhN (UPF0104 family)
LKTTVRKSLIVSAKFVVIAGALAYLIVSGRLDLQHIHYETASWRYLLLAFAGIAGASALSFYRWHVLLHRIGSEIPLRTTFRLGMIGCFFNTFLLGSFGGDLVKLAYAVRATPQRVKAAASILVDRLAGLTGLLALGALAIGLNWSDVLATPALHPFALALFGILGGMLLCLLCLAVSISIGRAYAFLGLALLLLGQCLLLRESVYAPGGLSGVALKANAVAVADVLLAGAAVLVVPHFFPGRRFHDALQRIPFGIGRGLTAFLDAIFAFRQHPLGLTIAFLLSCVIQAASVLSVYLVALALGWSIGLDCVFFATPPTFISNVPPLPLGGLGVGEWVFDFILSLCPRPDAMGTLTGGATIFLAWRTLQYLAYIVAGLPVYLRNRQEIHDIEARVREQAAREEHP